MKVSNSYGSVVRGVSQQTASQRLDGQHEEQVNMLSDPVEGLSRRRGSIYASEQNLGSNLGTDYMRGIRTFDVTIAGVDYVVTYPTLSAPGGSWLSAIKAYRKDNNTWCNAVINSSDSLITSGMMDTGIASITQVGRYIIMAPNATVFGGGGGSGGWAGFNNQRYGIFWVRGGAYSRQYKLEVVVNGIRRTATYTTPAAAYQGTLDTSDIPATVPDGSGGTKPNPDYTKLVNDRVNAYNSAVTQWIASAGAAIQPPAIAASLTAALNAVMPAGSTVLANGPYIYVENFDLDDMSGSDGGDGSFLRTTYLVTTAVDQLSAQHFPGKIMKIQAKEGDPSFYMKAVAMNGTTGFGPVTWEETAGTVSATPFPFIVASVADGALHMASLPLYMRTLNAAYATLPDMGQRVAGDDVSSPTPAFENQRINHVAQFQDRLVVVNGSVVSMSRTGDYFNFYRETNLTVRDDDPIQVYALGSEADIIRHSLIFDKSMVMFGDKQQYSIDGRIPITPSTGTVIQSSAHEDATDAAPISNGQLVFFGKARETSAKMYQIEIGNVQDTTNAVEVSLQLTDYLGGKPVQMIGTTSPDLILFRTSGNYNRIGVFRYVDTKQGRILDAWSSWKYSPDIGEIVALSRYKDQVLILHHKVTGGVSHYVMCKQSLLANRPDTPYLDAQRPYGSSSAALGVAGQVTVVMGNHAHRYERAPGVTGALANLQADYPTLTSSDVRQGFDFDAYTDLTSPFRRDQNGNVIVTGRLTIGRVDVSFKQTSGLDAFVTTDFGTTQNLHFIGRLLGGFSSTFKVPVEDGSVPVFVGKESREYIMRLQALPGKPLTITVLEWTGQYFYNTRRG